MSGGEYQFWTYMIFMNYATTSATYWTPENTVTNWQNTVPIKLGSNTESPLIGDQITEQNNTGLFWNPLPGYITGQKLRNDWEANYLYGDGNVLKYSSGFSKFITKNNQEYIWHLQE